MKTIKMSLVAALAAAVATTGANAGALDQIITNPKLDIEIRPRYEHADVDGGTDAADAFTVRTAIGVNMGLFGVEGLNAQLQGMNVSNFGWVTDYAPEVNDGYDTIMDPSQSRITQANISYTTDGLTVLAGRKMVVLDNARFIGNVGWRQMPQTYDLAAAIYGYENLSLLGAYVWQVNTITKDGELDTGSVLLHAAYKVAPELTVTAYDYMIQNFADHIGLRATGKADLGDFALKYEAEYAMQNDPSLTESGDPLYTKDDDQEAIYYKVGMDAMVSGFTAGVAYEVLGEADGGRMSFNTPLATKHAMNGWADVFLATPQEGLCDLSFKLAYNAGEYGKLMGVYHMFTSDVDNAAGDDDLGDEIDVAYKVGLAKNLGLLLKGAFYSAGDDSFGKFDTTKYWVQLDYKFHAEY